MKKKIVIVLSALVLFGFSVFADSTSVHGNWALGGQFGTNINGGGFGGL